MTSQEKGDLLIRFISILRQGLVKPNDITANLKKIDDYAKRYNETGDYLEDLKKCCMSEVEVGDCKDVKKYILAACDKFADVMELNVR